MKFEVNCTNGAGKVIRVVVAAPTKKDAHRMAMAQTGLPKVTGSRQLPS